MTEEQKYCLYKKLMAIDRDKMEVLNKRFCRKRMISIYYLISKFLEGMKNVTKIYSSLQDCNEF